MSDNGNDSADAVRENTKDADLKPEDEAKILRPLAEDLDGAIDNLLSDTLKGIETGFPRTDKLTRGLRDLVILAGAPGVGKSTWALQAALNVSARGEPVLYYSLEMPRLEMQRRALLACAGEVGTWDVLRKDDHSRRRAAEAVKQSARALYLVDQSTRVGLNEIRAHVETMKERHDRAPLVVVDHARLVNMGETYRSVDELGRQEDLLAELMALSQRTGATVLLVHELNKAGMDGLTLQGIKGTVSAVYDAATVMGLIDPDGDAKENLNNLTEYTGEDAAPTGPKRLRLVVRKNRYGPANLWIPYTFDGAASRFTEDRLTKETFRK